MYILKDFSVLENIISRRKQKKIVIFGTDTYANSIFQILKMLSIEISYFIGNDDKSPLTKSIYDLLYEDKEKIFIIIPQAGKAAESNRKQVARILGQDFIKSGVVTIYDAGGILTWDTIDINLGYIQEKQFQEFSSSNEISNDFINIVTLGGSTTYWNFMWECKCWSELLMELYKDAGRKVKIFCGGMQGYTSTQEMIKCIRDVISMAPDLVICLSGANDVVREAEFEQYPFAFEHLRVLFCKTAEIYGKENLPISYGLKSSLDNAEQWVLNMKIMRETLRIKNINFVSFLQPMLNIKSQNLSCEEKYAINKENRIVVKQYLHDNMNFCDKVEQLTENIDYIISLKNLFEGQDVFFDHVHVYENGNRLIAKAIYKYIKDI